MVRSDLIPQRRRKGIAATPNRSFVTDDRGRMVRLANVLTPIFASEAGGFTFEPMTATDVGRAKKYAVAIPGYERRYVGVPTFRERLAFIEDVAGLLFDPLSPRFLGGWKKSPDEWIFDVVELIGDFDEALAFAEASGQEAFTFLLTLQEFKVEEELLRNARIHRQPFATIAN